MISTARLRFASRVAGIHFSLSLLIAPLVASLVFFVWYPAPYRGVMGSFKLFWLIVGVDVVCGPLLTLILSNPEKKRREMILDLSLVAIIQLSAFIYGLHNVYEARPIVVVYEIDRFRALATTDIYQKELPQAPQEYQKLPLWDIWLLATREKKTDDDTLKDIELAMQGYDIGQRPSWWIPYDEGKSKIKEKAHPLQALLENTTEDKKALIQQAITRSGLPIEKLYYLPFTSSRSTEWAAILDDRMDLLDVIPVDAFDRLKRPTSNK